MVDTKLSQSSSRRTVKRKLGKRLLPPIIYKLVTFRFSFPKFLRDLFIPGLINKNNKLKAFRLTGLYGVYGSFSEVKSNMWDDGKVVQSRIDQLASLSHEEIVVSDLTKDNTLFFFLINNILRERDCRVLDFGGASGHYYYHARQHSKGSGTLRWNVVDLPHTIAVGEQYAKENGFEDVTFHEDVEDVPAGDVDIVYSNAVFQYIENAYDFIRALAARGPEYMVYSRLPLSEETSFITSQVIEGRETAYGVFHSEEFFAVHEEYDYELLLCTSCSDYKHMNCDVPPELAIPCDRIIVFRKRDS